MFNSFKKYSPQGTASDQESNFDQPNPTPSTPAWDSSLEESTPIQSSQPTSVYGSSSAYGTSTPSYSPTINTTMQRAQASTNNVLNSDVEVIGKLRFVDNLLIDGIVDGEINSDGVLTIGQNARIKAEIRTNSVIIHGKVIGNITVTDRVELKSTAELVGDIHAASLSVDAGAIFIGRSTVGAPSMENISTTAGTSTMPTQQELVEQSTFPDEVKSTNA
ncbi:MAG: polymer-forming cytoskeletal protein [Akkermansia sp.]